MERRVLMLVDALDMTNGVSMTARQLADNWGDTNWHLTVYGTGVRAEHHHYPNARLRVATGPITLPLILYRDIMLSFPVLKTWREMRRASKGILHAATPGTLGLRGLWYAIRTGMPFVTTHHTRMTVYARLYVGDRFAEQADRIMEAIMRMMYVRSAATIVHSPGAGDEAREMGAKNIVYAPMGVPVPYMDIGRLRAEREQARARVRAELRLSGDQPTLLSVGRLAMEKSVDILLRAADALKQPIVFVGDGPMREEVQNSPYAISLGTKHGQELADLYLSADLFVNASITETLGRIFLESLAYGTPILLPRSGQQDSVLSDNCPAILKYRRDETYIGLDELVSAVRAFLDRPAEEREQLTEPALDFARQFAWENVLPLHIAPYEEILARAENDRE